MPYGADMNEVAAMSKSMQEKDNPVFCKEVTVSDSYKFSANIIDGGIVRFSLDQSLRAHTPITITCTIPGRSSGGGTIVVGSGRQQNK